MARLQEEIESKDDITNRLRKAEEDMEAHIAEIDRLEKLLKEKDGENNDQAYVQKQQVVEALEKEKEELLGNVESFKSEIEEMAKSYEKEKQDLCEKISELQLKVSQMDGELKVKKTLEVELQNSQVLRRQVAEERDELLKKLRDSQVVEKKTVSTEKDDSQAVIESLKLECISRETEIEQFKQTENQLRSEVLTLEQSKLDLEHKLHENNQELLKQKQEHEDEIERLKLVVVETQTGVRPEQGVVEEEVFEKDQVFTPVTGDAEPVKENRLLKQEVGTLKATIESLKVDLQNASDEKAALQNTLEQCEVTWENEKNTLQQQLYDSCLEASSFKVSWKMINSLL